MKKLKQWCGTLERNILWTILGILIGFIFFNLFIFIPDNILDILKVLSGIVITVSVGIGAQQFRFNRKQVVKNNQWNKKQLGMTETHKSRVIIKKMTTNLQGTLNFLERDCEVIPLSDIHNSFGAFLNENEFIFHGTDGHEAQKNITESSFHRDDKHIKYLKDDVDGREMRESLWILLGEYEYICNGINHDIFDENIIASLMGASIMKTYIQFSDYIEHLRLDKGSKGHNSPLAYIELEKTALSIYTNRNKNNVCKNYKIKKFMELKQTSSRQE